jgi:hypothetical protein
MTQTLPLLPAIPSYEESLQILAAIADHKKFDFVYYAHSQILIGNVDGQSFVTPAESGGGRGGTNPDFNLDTFLPTRATKKDKHNKYIARGGSLPPGLWRIEKPSTYKGKMKGLPIAPLTPIGNQTAGYPMREYVVEPFLIHGDGGRGSDGCIVINQKWRKPLLAAIERSGPAILLVTAITELGALVDNALRPRPPMR